MNTKKTILSIFGLLLSFGVFAQSTNCTKMIQLYSSNAKVENYKAAKPMYKKLVKNCPSKYLALYQYGARMFNHLIDNAPKAKKKQYAKALIENYRNRLQYFPSKTQKGETLAKIAQVMYDYGVGTKQEQYKVFDKAWEQDKATFVSPKNLYTYFSLLVDLQDAGKKSLKTVFQKYNEVSGQIEMLRNTQAEKMATLLEKKDKGVELSAKEERVLSNADIYLTNYSKITKGIKAKLGKRANCENLIPLYKKDFAKNKDNLEWLKTATSMMFQKGCTDTDLFAKLVEAQHAIKPSAESALYIGKLAEENGNISKAMKYYKEAAELQDNASDRATVYYVIANNYKDQGRYGSARVYYRKALNNKPSLGAAYLQIASMYANSANNCGSNSFEKRAVYWIAADYARRAARVNPAIKSSALSAARSYEGRAPSRTMIFNSGRAGQTISVDCWINESVTVPTL